MESAVSIIHANSHVAIQSDSMIAKLRVAQEALDAASTLEQVKTVSDVAFAAEIFAKRQCLGEEVEMMARRIKLDSMRKLGQMLKAAPKHPGGRPDGAGPIPSLMSLGISQSTAAFSYRLAEMDDADFFSLKESKVNSALNADGQKIRSRRRFHRTSGTLMQFPLPGGRKLAGAEKKEIRKAAELLYTQSETMAAEARWLALVAAELKDDGRCVDHARLTESRLQELWRKAARK